MKKHLINYYITEEREQLLNIPPNKPLFIIKRKKDIFPDTIKLLIKRLNILMQS